MGAAQRTNPPVDRVIAVSTTDSLRFAPDAFNVRAGETVAFDISNSGAVPHEFIIGDATVQQVHENEMSTGRMGGESTGVTGPAGATVGLVYTFGQPGTLEIGCHVPGHYAAGMRGTITISPS